MFGRMWFLKNLLFFVLVGQLTATKITETEARMFEMINGKYDTSVHGAGPDSGRDLLKGIAFPVFVQAISSKPLLFFLETVNEKLVRAQLRTIEETSPGVITMEVYNIKRPDVKEWNPETFNRTEIENLKADEVEHLDGCKSQFEFFGDHFVGGWENCKDTVNGKHTAYGLTIYCDAVIASVPVVAPEKSNLLPYDIVLKSKKYPIIDPPENYKSVCEKKNAEDGHKDGLNNRNITRK